MTTSGKTLEQVVGESLTRLASAWPSASWSSHRKAEYRDALRQVGDAAVVEAGVTKAIRGWGGNFPPSVANLLEIVQAEVERQRPTGTTGVWPPPGVYVPSNLDEVIPTMPAWIAEVMQRKVDELRGGA